MGENSQNSTSPLLIIRQNSLSVEQVYRNGISKKVHVVVKNHPFLIQVGLAATQWNNQRIDFNRCPLEATLIYDNDSMKEVSFVKLKPIEYKPHVNERGDQATLEIRPKVLTSQLEDMLFKIKVSCTDNVTKQPIPGLFAFSESVKVVSKPEQVKKKKEPKPKAPKEKEPTVKRPIEQVVGEGLTRIENNVLNTDRLLGVLSLFENALNSEFLEQQQQQATIIKLLTPTEKKVKEEAPVHPFEQAFKDFLDAYDNIDHFDRPEKIRKVIKSSTPRDVETITTMVDMFTESVSCSGGKSIQHEKEFGHSLNGSACQCVNCPHKEELLKIDDFYNRFLFPADNSGGLIL